MIKKLLIIALSFSSSEALPQSMDDVPQTKVYRSSLLSVGSMNRLDTYLSPLEYKGTDVRFISNVLRERQCQWDIQLTHEGAFDYTSNTVDNAHALAGHYDFAFAMMHRWTLMDNKLTLRLGGMADLYLGFAYNMHNSANNPAQGYASLAVGGAGKASYTFQLWHKNMTLNYDARLPLGGIMFSPNYEQSYYEMFSRGNYDNNVVFTSVAVPSFRQMLSLDVPVGKRTAITLGYLGDYRQAKPNNLKQHTYTHAFVIGVTKQLR